MAVSPTSYDCFKLGTTAGAGTVVDNVTSLEMSDTKSETTSVYVGKKFARTTTGARTITIDLGVDFEPGDTHFAMLETAYEGGSEVFATIIEDPGATAGSQGWEYPCEVATFSKSFDPAGVISVSVGLRLSGDPVAV